MTENEMVGWHHWLNGHGFGWTPGAGDGQGSLACCSPWGHKESEKTERLTEHLGSPQDPMCLVAKKKKKHIKQKQYWNKFNKDFKNDPHVNTEERKGEGRGEKVKDYS